jgi:hypothetical protein
MGWEMLIHEFIKCRRSSDGVGNGVLSLLAAEHSLVGISSKEGIQ